MEREPLVLDDLQGRLAGIERDLPDSTSPIVLGEVDVPTIDRDAPDVRASAHQLDRSSAATRIRTTPEVPITPIFPAREYTMSSVVTTSPHARSSSRTQVLMVGLPALASAMFIENTPPVVGSSVWFVQNSSPSRITAPVMPLYFPRSVVADHVGCNGPEGGVGSS